MGRRPPANPVQVYGPPAPVRVTGQPAVPFVVSVTNAGASNLNVTAINYVLSTFNLGYYFFHYDGIVDGKIISANPCSSSLTVLTPRAGCDVVMTFKTSGGTGTVSGGIEIPVFSASDGINRTGFVPVTQVIQ